METPHRCRTMRDGKGRQRFWDDREMMAEGGPDDRMQNAPRYLRQVGNGIPPWKNGHTITSESTSADGHHREKQKRVGKMRKQ